MSCAIDANILLYATDTAGPNYARARSFMEQCVGGTELVYLAWPTLMAYLRIVTHPAIFSQPLSPQEATANVESMLSLPHVRTLGERDGFWDAYKAVTATVPTRGNLVPDAQLAALLRQHGVRHLATHDSDFRKFAFLEIIDPLADEA